MVKIISEESTVSSLHDSKVGEYVGLFMANERVYYVSISRHGGKNNRGKSWMRDTYSGIVVWEREYEISEEQKAINSVKGIIDNNLNVELEVEFYKDMLNKMEE
ncbi:MAG: hypothetical protein AMQ74_01617 [Candidatus Methanofastidiosum methylothiophilum]|uniref:Uncharacterized protein n=1 Tax=Candidatus Methanofastidiosum methylothiophilum TaxID=1705564 RepID=A0A150IT95_9EURY|nr:MAG: hypothetical protein AMQ74_01617 [Candidatus Methanofastidiosum methylthiophilus]